MFQVESLESGALWQDSRNFSDLFPPLMFDDTARRQLHTIPDELFSPDDDDEADAKHSTIVDTYDQLILPPRILSDSVPQETSSEKHDSAQVTKTRDEEKKLNCSDTLDSGRTLPTKNANETTSAPGSDAQKDTFHARGNVTITHIERRKIRNKLYARQARRRKQQEERKLQRRITTLERRIERVREIVTKHREKPHMAKMVIDAIIDEDEDAE